MARSMILILLTLACARGADSATTRSDRPLGEVLAASGRDTIWLDTTKAGGALRWTRHTQGRPQIVWESRALAGATPEVRFARIDDDSTVDLFWTVDHEEMVGGAIVLGRAGQATVAVETRPVESCRVPELRDVNGDGKLDFVSYEPGALDASACHGDAQGDVCREAYPTEWAVAHVQQAGRFERSSALVRQFYQRQSEAYANAASELRKSIAAKSGPPATSSLCNEDMARALVGLAQRAKEAVLAN